jgi:hypothetical protein
MRNEELKELFLSMIGRLNAPRAITNNSEGMKREAEILTNVIIKNAPTRGYKDWFNDFEEALLGNLETRTWPTIKEMHRAAKQISTRRPEFRDLTGDNKYTPDPFKINAGRIKRGEPVDEHYINGTEAQKLLNKGLVTEADIQPYKEALTAINNY